MTTVFSQSEIRVLCEVLTGHIADHSVDPHGKFRHQYPKVVAEASTVEELLEIARALASLVATIPAVAHQQPALEKSLKAAGLPAWADCESRLS